VTILFLLAIDTFTTAIDVNDSLSEDWSSVNYHGRRFYAIFFTFSYVVPLSLVCILYGLMLKRLLYGATPGGGQGATTRGATTTTTTTTTLGSSAAAKVANKLKNGKMKIKR